MLSLPGNVRVFVATAPCDMRGSFDALAGHVRRLGLEPVDGAVYVFYARSRKHLALLHFDGSGWCLFRKRLECGTFEVPQAPAGATRIAVDGRLLASILDGIDLRAPRRRWYRHRTPAEN